MNSRQLKIIIIDDENIVGKRLKQAFEKDGYEVVTFVDPEEALDYYNENYADIIVTDIRMDKIDGIELLDRVQSDSGGTKIIVITGYATIEIAREALTKGAYDFIAKPFKPSDLRVIVDRAAKELTAV
jgi:DNA-binding NtrC family response regulator